MAFFAITFEVQTVIGAMTRLVNVLGALARSVQWEYLGTFDRLSILNSGIIAQSWNL